MKTTLIASTGQAISIDLADVSMIEQGGQRDSSTGLLMVKLLFRSGNSINVKIPVSDYDQLVTDWNPPAA